jgi:hypothetical protein
MEAHVAVVHVHHDVMELDVVVMHADVAARGRLAGRDAVSRTCEQNEKSSRRFRQFGLVANNSL